MDRYLEEIVGLAKPLIDKQGIGPLINALFQLYSS